MILLISNLFQNNNTTWIMLVLILVIIVIMIFSSIRKRKQDKIEKEKRQKEVRDRIKQYLKDNGQITHKIIEYDKVVSRAGKDYKYRDVFDVIIKLYDSKSHQLYATKAFEVEGLSKQIGKKKYEISWQVNKELDLDETLLRLKETVTKSYWKMSKLERSLHRLTKEQTKNQLKQERKEEKLKKRQKVKTKEKVAKANIKKQPVAKFGAKK